MTTLYSSPETRTFYTTPHVTQTDLYRIRYYRELIQNAKERLQYLLAEPERNWTAIQLERITIHQTRQTLQRIRSLTPYLGDNISF